MEFLAFLLVASQQVLLFENIQCRMTAMSRDKIQHFLTLFCAFILCMTSFFSIYRISEINFFNLTILFIGFSILFLGIKKKKIARYISGLIYWIGGVIIFLGLYNPTDGNIYEPSSFEAVCAFVVSVFSLLAASLCLDPP
jgi:hypothetical protein